MWVYTKQLEVPVEPRRTNPRLASYIFAQFGGPDSEFGAAWRYFSQSFAAPTTEARAVLIDIGTEELAHLEMIGTLIRKLTEDATPAELAAAGMGAHYAQHGYNLWLHDAAGVPWTTAYVQSYDDPVTIFHENLAAEAKARSGYEAILDLAKGEGDEGVNHVLAFLRQREVTHFQRFGEELDRVQEWLDQSHQEY